MKTKTRNVVLMAALIAIMLLMGFTPIGYIPLPFAKLTLMCLPVIIGTLVLGLRTGIALSGVFFLTSVVQLLTMPDAVSLLLFESNPVVFILCLLIPRLLIPLTTHGMHKLLSKKIPKGSLVMSAAVGSLTNTFLYLGMLQWLFVPALAAGLTLDAIGVSVMIWTVVLTNGLPEAVLAAIICPLVANALQKTIKPIPPKAVMGNPAQ
ncbi:MAG: ECF transporter S component [Christensenellaceae bacterium]